MPTVEDLYKTFGILAEAKDKVGEHQEEYLRILEAARGGPNEKRLASQFIARFFRHFPDLATRALDAQIDLCEDDDVAIRKQAIKDLPKLCKDNVAHLPKIADVLAQLLQSEDATELGVVQASLMSLFEIDAKGTLAADSSPRKCRPARNCARKERIVSGHTACGHCRDDVAQRRQSKHDRRGRQEGARKVFEIEMRWEREAADGGGENAKKETPSEGGRKLNFCLRTECLNERSHQLGLPQTPQSSSTRQRKNDSKDFQSQVSRDRYQVSRPRSRDRFPWSRSRVSGLEDAIDYDSDYSDRTRAAPDSRTRVETGPAVLLAQKEFRVTLRLQKKLCMERQKNAHSTAFVSYMCAQVLPSLASVGVGGDGSDMQLELLKLLADMAAFAPDVTEPAVKLGAVYARLVEYLDLPPEAAAGGGGSENGENETPSEAERKLNFSYAECLMHTFHQLGSQHPEFLTANEERLKDFRVRLQYFAQGVQGYIKKLREALHGKAGEALKSDENKLKVLALKMTTNINTLIKDLFHNPPSYKNTITLSWKPTQRAAAAADVKLVATGTKRTPITFDSGDTPAKKSTTTVAKEDRKIYAPPSGKFSDKAGSYQPGKAETSRCAFVEAFV
ncbi:PREDICTED: apoptosis inhibitor 5-like [Priapulus caudatus]|uniref:Apoptosis inhibitor 5-like n=1 Tax=Priapulus caudatus TaxID=37621 RepID=A0ABM1EWB1_PRICU|nr:PREDICTED: apoptosis inhibitor 5-like [Priapulus caudatus]